LQSTSESLHIVKKRIILKEKATLIFYIKTGQSIIFIETGILSNFYYKMLFNAKLIILSELIHTTIGNLFEKFAFFDKESFKF